MTVYIITGTTKGIGKALVEQLQADDQSVVIGLSRSDAMAAPRWINIPCDLSDPDEQGIIAAVEKAVAFNPDRLVLINNAGQLQPIAKMGDCDSELLKTSINVNLTAPLMLINLFIRHSKNCAADRMIVNISSGAAHSPYSGWSAYCSSKAGLDMLTKTVATEQHPKLSVVSIAPGVVDTGMQDQIRGTSKSDFAMVDKFHALKSEGHLYTTEFVADKIIKFINSGSYTSGALYDLRDM